MTGLSGAVHFTEPLSMDYQIGLPSKPLTFKNKYYKWKDYIKLDCQIAKLLSHIFSHKKPPRADLKTNLSENYITEWDGYLKRLY